VTDLTPTPDPLPVPATWANTDLAALTDAQGAAAALRSGFPQDWMTEHNDIPSGFETEFWNRLRGPRGHVILQIPTGISSVGAATMVAAWMGLRPDQVHDDIGGTVSHVTSGAGHRHDQSWHTDSTAWNEPNRYSVLGLLQGAGASDQATDLLALACLRPGLADDPAAWAALQTEPIPWRRNFPHLPGLAAPVFATPHPRWVWPVVEELMDELSENLQRGVTSVERLINQVPYHSPVVTRSRLLVFNNGQMLHRGPHLEESSGRELIRIKVAGQAMT